MKLTIDIPREDYDALCDLGEKEKTNGLDYYKRLIANGSEPKTGHWIEHKHGGIEHIECSKCHVWFLRGHLTRNTYCPECGSYNGGAKE